MWIIQQDLGVIMHHLPPSSSPSPHLCTHKRKYQTNTKSPDTCLWCQDSNIRNPCWNYTVKKRGRVSSTAPCATWNPGSSLKRVCGGGEGLGEQWGCPIGTLSNESFSLGFLSHLSVPWCTHFLRYTFYSPSVVHFHCSNGNAFVPKNGDNAKAINTSWSEDIKSNKNIEYSVYWVLAVLPA